ncbi:acyl-CoA thioesterase [Bacillus massiliigorillae]|uniref:acyl-CoA thioesterase n=1 Tax=Bacillus massiliigorillae TaxID=1243664 RepID=UPI0003A8645F|nr:thioesterase family protein [Bacillus massiliigorillae]
MTRISYIDDMELWQQDFRFSHTVKVRFSETDMFGHLNNTVPITYFELARVEFFNHLGLMKKWLDTDNETLIVVADVQCDYLKQVYYDEQITLYVKTDRIGNSSVDLHYMGRRDNGEIVFTGRGMVVQISRITGKSIPWTDEIKSIYKEQR